MRRGVKRDAFDARLQGGLHDGGAATSRSPERGEHRRRAAAYGGGTVAHERERRGEAGEEQKGAQLTLEPLLLVAATEMAGHDGKVLVVPQPDAGNPGRRQ